MKKFLRIKFENIILLLMFSATIYAWVVYFKYATETKMLALASITTFMHLIMMFNYKTIRDFRKLVIKFW